MTAYNTRIAPSPTGYFHLGTARTAYFNWLAARATGGKFILRIDDTDANRDNEAMVQVIYDAMEYLGLGFDKTFRQSERREHHINVARGLVINQAAVERDGAIWLNPDLPPPAFMVGDLTGGLIALTELDREYLKRMVIVKSDGTPTYHFASVVDDIDEDINLVIRGTDHIANTMKQVAIYNALGMARPQYAHVGLLHDLGGKKLSKSTGAKSLLDFRDEGVDSEAMLNFLLRLGWAPKVDDKSTAILDRNRAIELFLSAGNLRSASSKVDFAKLDSFDRKYKARLKAAA